MNTPVPLMPSAPDTTSVAEDGSPAPGAQRAVQRIIKIRRDYNSWVASETKEDYALRFAPLRFRKWSEWRVAKTAFGAASFLILEAVGATLLVQYGFTNAMWAILATGLIIFLAGLPVSIYAARYGVDMDLLTRGAVLATSAPPLHRSSMPPSPLSFSRWKRPSWRMRWTWRWASHRVGVT